MTEFRQARSRSGMPSCGGEGWWLALRTMNRNRTLDLGDLTDEALRAEIELIGELVVAASACPGRMGLAELDSILGVRR